MVEKPLKIENIWTDLESTSKEKAIEAVGRHLVSENYAKPEYVQSMLNREKHLTTYMGNHIAIPHGEDGSGEFVNKTGIVVHHYPNGIKFDDEIAYLLFGIAAKNTEHIEILSNIAIVFSDIDEVNNLFSNKITKEKLFNLLNEGN